MARSIRNNVMVILMLLICVSLVVYHGPKLPAWHDDTGSGQLSSVSGGTSSLVTKTNGSLPLHFQMPPFQYNRWTGQGCLLSFMVLNKASVDVRCYGDLGVWKSAWYSND